MLGYIRLPYSLAVRGEFPRSDRFTMVEEKSGISMNSALFSLVMVLIWSLLHFLSVFEVELGFIKFSGLQVDSLPIVLTYVFYGSLYLRLLIDYVRYKEGRFVDGIVYPVLALVGASLVLFGGMSDPNGIVYFIISFIGIGAGLLIRPRTHQ